ncbi:MAG: hypothetical protein Q8O27_00775 [Enterobacteriaceae bacterium]|nr:hypothetical protein [Enterobacteriaceae bacterium]
MKKQEKIMFDATTIARENSQTVGEKRDYYITLAQLERILIMAF